MFDGGERTAVDVIVFRRNGAGAFARPRSVVVLDRSCDAYQKPAAIFMPNTRGRSGTIALMNWADVVKVEACESNRFVL